MRKRINTYFFCILDGCSGMHTCIPLIVCQNNKTVNKGERKVTVSWQNPSTNGAILTLTLKHHVRVAVSKESEKNQAGPYHCAITIARAIPKFSGVLQVLKSLGDSFVCGHSISCSIC